MGAEAPTNKRYWCSWWSGAYEDEDCTAPPFQVWPGATRPRADGGGRDEVFFCAVVDAPGKRPIWEAIQRHYPDAEAGFCDETYPDFEPTQRYPDFGGWTALTFDQEGDPPCPATSS